MGFGGISIWQLLIVLLIVVLLFGTKKLKNVGSDLGSAMKSFRSAVRETDEEEERKRSEREREQLARDADNDTAATDSARTRTEDEKTADHRQG